MSAQDVALWIRRRFDPLMSRSTARSRSRSPSQCLRLSWRHFSADANAAAALTAIADLAGSIHDSREIPYIGVTEQPARRLHGMGPASHFPRFRAMMPVAAGSGLEMARLEGAALHACRDRGIPLANSPTSTGGERVARDARSRYIYVCSTGWEGTCSCDACARFFADLGESQLSSSHLWSFYPPRDDNGGDNNSDDNCDDDSNRQPTANLPRASATGRVATSLASATGPTTVTSSASATGPAATSSASATPPAVTSPSASATGPTTATPSASATGPSAMSSASPTGPTATTLAADDAGNDSDGSLAAWVEFWPAILDFQRRRSKMYVRAACDCVVSVRCNTTDVYAARPSRIEVIAGETVEIEIGVRQSISRAALARSCGPHRFEIQVRRGALLPCSGAVDDPSVCRTFVASIGQIH